MYIYSIDTTVKKKKNGKSLNINDANNNLQ